jgi:hypothetical protein
MGSVLHGRKAKPSGLDDTATGERHAFTAAPVKRPAGLYRIETKDGAGYLGGWIVLADGRTRGAVKTAERIVKSGTLSFVNPIGGI